MAEETPTSPKLHEICNATVLDIWRRHSDALADLPGLQRMPMIRGEFVMCPELLFVGMNPSFSDVAAKRVNDKLKSKGHDIEDIFRWDSTCTEEAVLETLPHLLDAEESAQDDYLPYYGPLKRFKKAVDAATMEHLDMFLLRHTKQADVEKAHWGKGELNEFAGELFDLFSRTLVALAPKVVVIANAGAARLAEKRLGLHAEENYYTWDVKLPGTPFFLCGMLSGQRALDTYSRDRLAYDVRAALARRRR